MRERIAVSGGEPEDLLARGAQASMMSNAVLGGVVKVPFQFLAKMISDSEKDGAKVIASGLAGMLISDRKSRRYEHV